MGCRSVLPRKRPREPAAAPTHSAHRSAAPGLALQMQLAQAAADRQVLQAEAARQVAQAEADKKVAQAEAEKQMAAAALEAERARSKVVKDATKQEAASELQIQIWKHKAEMAEHKQQAAEQAREAAMQQTAAEKRLGDERIKTAQSMGSVQGANRYTQLQGCTAASCGLQ